MKNFAPINVLLYKYSQKKEKEKKGVFFGKTVKFES